MENLHDKRQVYDKFQLSEAQVKDNPIEQFKSWLVEADQHPDIAEANAMSLSTMDQDNCPSTRMMLLKSYSSEGFVFYTNYGSKKGQSIEENNRVCLHFFWPQLERQVMIKARAERVEESLSDEYFSSRPRGSQLGALVSAQSQEVDKEYIMKKLKELELEYEGKDIPRPKSWGGYIAKPYQVEFWQGRPNRLHDRIVYTLQENSTWKISRLAP